MERNEAKHMGMQLSVSVFCLSVRGTVFPTPSSSLSTCITTATFILWPTLFSSAQEYGRGIVGPGVAVPKFTLCVFLYQESREREFWEGMGAG